MVVEQASRRPVDIRVEVAKVLSRALKLTGSREALAERLGVSPREILGWIALEDDAPCSVIVAAVEVLLEDFDRRAA